MARSISNRPITVFGSMNVDFSVVAARLPIPGESLVGDQFMQAFGGKGANQAVGISRLNGGRVRFIGAVGDDPLGRAGLASLRESCIDIDHVRTVPGVNTGVALIMIDHQGENSIVAAPGANQYVDADYVESLPDEVFSSSSLIVLCQEIPVESLELITARAKALGVSVLFNPAPPNPRLMETMILKNVDFLTPNETEAAALTGLDAATIGLDDHKQSAMERMLGCGTFSIAMTMGSAGCFVFDQQMMSDAGEAKQIAAPLVETVDTTGAGDSFNAALAVALAKQRPFWEACQWANQAAAISVTRRGTQVAMPYLEELPSL